MRAAERRTQEAVAAETQLEQPPLYRFSVEQYHRMIETGVLREHDRVELREGRVVLKMTHNPPHDGTVWLLQTAFLSKLPAEWLLRVQSAITTRDSEPEPDLVVARGPGSRYFRAHPRPADITLVVEVADATLLQDRTGQGRLNARGRIPVYWVVNLPEEKIEVYTQPRGGKTPGYRQRQDYEIDQSVLLVIDGQEIAQFPVRDLLVSTS